MSTVARKLDVSRQTIRKLDISRRSIIG
ncbi:hypothetical protein [Mesorhizobium sp. M0244]